jgi:hypothetical protein
VANRSVFQVDAFAWMDENPAKPGTSVITSLPDVSELSGYHLDDWKEWFVRAARRVLRWIPDDGVAVFYQSDIRHRGAWIDKGHLVMCAADAEKATVLWHTIVCRKPPGTIALGRPSYSHMICIARTPRPVHHPGPDVMPDAGEMSWSKAMGAEACRTACRFLREDTATKLVVDPFCGRGTVLAVANEMGFDAIGVDIGGKRVRIARGTKA